jgi:hypothetical protein
MPEPPVALASRKVSLIKFDEALFRSHQIKRNPIHYGRSRIHRFDAPDGSYGVLYAGRDAYCAFIETFARSAGARIVTTAELEARALSELKATRPLNLIDLTQSGALAWIGAASTPSDTPSCCTSIGPKLVELSRQSWYAPGPRRRLLVEIIEHYKLDLIESHSVAPRKPPAKARQEEMF